MHRRIIRAKHYRLAGIGVRVDLRDEHARVGAAVVALGVTGTDVDSHAGIGSNTVVGRCDFCDALCEAVYHACGADLGDRRIVLDPQKGHVGGLLTRG